MVRKEIVSQVVVFNSFHNIFLQDQSCWFRLQQVYGLIPGHWIEAGVLCFNSSSDRPNAVSSANVQGSVLLVRKRD